MQRYDLALERHWVTHVGYFILSAAVAFGMEMIDGNHPFYHGISEASVDNKNPTREYNNRMVYECFNNPFSADCGRPDLNIHPIRIDDRPHPNKIADIPQIFSQLPSLLPLKTLLLT